MATGTFTDLCENVLVEKTKKVATHPLFLEMAKGSLAMERFERLIQQDTLYLRRYYLNYTIMTDKEVNPAYKELLTKYSKPGTSMELMLSYFPQFDIETTAKAESYTKNYIDWMKTAALDSSVGESLATYYPCRILWHKAGLEMAKVAKYENNKYSRFVKALTDKGTSSLDQFQALINDYYERASESEKKGMMRNYAVAVQMEIDFCDGVYHNKK